MVFDEGADLTLEVAGQDVLREQHTVPHGLVPALDLAPRPRVVSRPTDMIHALFVEVLRQIAGDVGRAIATEQPGLGDQALSQAAHVGLGALKALNMSAMPVSPEQIW